MKDLKKLEDRIRELVPESMELSFGCKALVLGKPYVFIARSSIRLSGYWNLLDNKKKLRKISFSSSLANDHEILGHPITLEHCRVALTRYAEKERGITPAGLLLCISNRWFDLEPWKDQTEAHLFLEKYLL